MEKAEDGVAGDEDGEPAGPREPGYVVAPGTATGALGRARPPVSACPSALAGPAWERREGSDRDFY